jgi:hypothetical protein
MKHSNTHNKSRVKLIKQNFLGIKILRERPRHLQSQGCIKKGNDTFKKRFDKWIADHSSPGKPAEWRKNGVYTVVRGINNRPHEARGMTIPFETYFGMKTNCNIEHMVDAGTYAMLTIEHAYFRVVELFQGLFAVEYHSGVHQDILRTFVR